MVEKKNVRTIHRAQTGYLLPTYDQGLDGCLHRMLGRASVHRGDGAWLEQIERALLADALMARRKGDAKSEILGRVMCERM